jgi:hypothetical protein
MLFGDALLAKGAAQAAGFRRKAKGESIGEKRTRLDSARP